MCEERQCLYKFYLCFIRIFAPKCAACGEGITPVEGTSDTVRVVAMEKDFHVDCYVCEVGNFLVRNSLTQNRIITKNNNRHKLFYNDHVYLLRYFKSSGL